MAKETLNNGETGSVIRGKINDNFTEVYAQVSDTAYGVGWNGDTTVAPSKNAVYDIVGEIFPPLGGSPREILYDSFMGVLRFSSQTANSGGTTNTNGQLSLVTATNSAARSSLGFQGPGSTSFTPTAGIDMRFSTKIVWLSTLPDATENYYFSFGPNRTAGIPTEHMSMFQLRWDGTSVLFEAVTRATGTQDTTSLTLPSASARVVLDIVWTGTTDIKYYVNGALVATHTNRPTSAATHIAHMIKTAGTTQRVVTLEWIYCEFYYP